MAFEIFFKKQKNKKTKKQKQKKIPFFFQSEGHTSIVRVQIYQIMMVLIKIFIYLFKLTAEYKRVD